MAAPINWRMAWSIIGQLPRQAGGGQWPPFRGALTACHQRSMTFTQIRHSPAAKLIHRCGPHPTTISPRHPFSVTSKVTFNQVRAAQAASAIPPIKNSEPGKSTAGLVLGC
jgi:hypothetical protein